MEISSVQAVRISTNSRIFNRGFTSLIDVEKRIKENGSILCEGNRLLKNKQSFFLGILVGVLIYSFLWNTSSKDYQVGHTLDGKLLKTLDRSIADELSKKVKILCFVLTSPENHKDRAIHVKNTWGIRCNKILFMSSAWDFSLNSVALPAGEGRHKLWSKTKESLKYIYQKFYDGYDWFLKSDDDTYVVVENLRYMLYSYNTSEPLYFGCQMHKATHFLNEQDELITDQIFPSGGAGYVLSKEAVKRFVEVSLKNSKLCTLTDSSYEDVELGRCLESVGVKMIDTRDEFQRQRFLPLSPEIHLIPVNINSVSWYWRLMVHKTKGGKSCCSDSAISFHYVTPKEMYVLDYLIYNLQPYGINYIAAIAEATN